MASFSLFFIIAWSRCYHRLYIEIYGDISIHEFMTYGATFWASIGSLSHLRSDRPMEGEPSGVPMPIYSTSTSSFQTVLNRVYFDWANLHSRLIVYSPGGAEDEPRNLKTSYSGNQGIRESTVNLIPVNHSHPRFNRSSSRV